MNAKSAAPIVDVDVDALRAVGRGGLALGPVSFTLDAGDALAVVGPSGAGKSLLLSAIAGLAPFTAHRCTRPADVAMIFQRDALDDGATALENVAVAARSVDVARAALVQVGLGEHVDRLPRSLSGGMRKRVGIARALARDAPLILADDPTAGLDPATAHAILGALFALSRTRGSALIIATADVDVLLPLCPRVLVVDDGTALYLGPPAGLASDARTAPFAPRALEQEAWIA